MAAISLLLGACGNSGSVTSTMVATTPTTPNTNTVPAPSDAVASAGCGSSAAPGTVTLTPIISGKVRTSIVHLPTGYQVSSPVALVINMHGSQSTALQQMGLTGMNATADADTFIVAYPQGDIPAAAGYEWNVPGQPLFGGQAVPAGSPDDVAFITQLVTLLEQKYCVDTNRVYATGFSGGARMASQLGCDASSVFAAIAPVSGLRLPTPCPSTRPVPVVSFHGTADPVDPYAGNGQQYWTYSVPVAAQRWGTHNGCAPTPQHRQADAGVVLTEYAPCSANAVVDLYSITGEGHEWPGGPHLPRAITRVLGPQSSAISANQVMWSFFMAHPLPRGGA